MRQNKLSGSIFLVAICLFPLELSWHPSSTLSAQEFSPVFSQLIPKDPQYKEQKSALALLDLEQAWDQSTGDSSVVVAIIDDAIDINHPDLRANIIAGYDFVDGDTDPSPGSDGSCVDETHGTAMASIIGAVGNNNTGMSGVNWNVKIMPLRIGCRYNSRYEQQAIAFALKNGADIINMSYGSPAQSGYGEELLAQMRASDALFVAAAGNYHGNNDYAPMFPADVDLPNMLSVAAVDGDNRLLHWTQYGAFNVDVAAPGVDIRSIDLANGRDSYKNVSGTSVSTAISSGVAALVKAKDLQDGFKTLDAMDIKSILMTSSIPVANAKGKLVSGGSINARKAMDFAEQPLIVVKNVSWVEESRIENAVFDPFESGVLLLTIENLWQSANSVTLEVVDHDEKLTLTSKFFDLGALQQKQTAAARLPIQVSALTGHHRFYFKLKLTASTNVNQVVVERDFFLESGALVDGEFVSSKLHEDAFDEYKYFQTSSPAGAENVVFELAYENAKYPMGLAVAHAQRPRIYYGMFGGEFYRLQGAERVRTSGYGVERLSLPLGSTANYHIAVFDLPKSFLAPLPEQSFQLRTCYTTQNNSNALPVVDAGTDITLAVGAELRLKGSAHDPDGNVSLLWWDVVTGHDVAFENSRDPLTKVEFPGSGIYELRLNASDSDCGYKADTINVIVGDENDLNSGLQVLPPSYSAPLGGHVSTNIQGQIEGQFVDSLRLYSAPLGVEFDDQQHILRWSNVGPVGEHKIRFSATSKTSSEIQTGYMTITVSDNNSNGDTFLGCTLRGGNSRDPIFVLMLLFSTIYLLRRPRIGS